MAGALIMKFHYKATGTDIVPNKKFWFALPLLLKVSVMFFLSIVMMCLLLSKCTLVAICTMKLIIIMLAFPRALG